MASLLHSWIRSRSPCTTRRSRPSGCDGRNLGAGRTRKERFYARPRLCIEYFSLFYWSWHLIPCRSKHLRKKSRRELEPPSSLSKASLLTNSRSVVQWSPNCAQYAFTNPIHDRTQAERHAAMTQTEYLHVSHKIWCWQDSYDSTDAFVSSPVLSYNLSL